MSDAGDLSEVWSPGLRMAGWMERIVRKSSFNRSVKTDWISNGKPNCLSER